VKALISYYNEYDQLKDLEWLFTILMNVESFICETNIPALNNESFAQTQTNLSTGSRDQKNRTKIAGLDQLLGRQ
jgi:hypothetical protein